MLKIGCHLSVSKGYKAMGEDALKSWFYKRCIVPFYMFSNQCVAFFFFSFPHT
jgi:hypothetical protein